MSEQAFMTSPIGLLEIWGSSAGISAVRLSGQRTVPDTTVPDSLVACVQQLEEYFDGKRRVFDLALDFGSASDFFKAVWHQLLLVPYGNVTTYRDIAIKLGNKGAVRAVGMANSRNPLAIVVPCHRCIATNGKLQGYVYGLDIKRRLLEQEHALTFTQQGNLF